MSLQQQRRTRAPFLPAVETLEDRVTPAVSYNLSTFTLTVKATDNIALTDTIDVTDKGTNGVSAVVVKVNGVEEFRSSARRQVRNINIRSGRGTDNVNYNLVAGMKDIQRTVDVKLEDGRDFFTANLSGSLSNAQLIFFVNGGRGSNDIQAGVKGGLLNGSFLGLFFTGGDAKDLLTIGATNNRTIDSLSQMTASINGGAGADTIRFDYAGLLQGALFLDAFGNGDNDAVAARLTLASPSTGQLLGPVSTNSGDAVAQVRGGTGADKLTFLVRGTPGELASPTFAEVDADPGEPVNVGNPLTSALTIAVV